MFIIDEYAIVAPMEDMNEHASRALMISCGLDKFVSATPTMRTSQHPMTKTEKKNKSNTFSIAKVSEKSECPEHLKDLSFENDDSNLPELIRYTIGDVDLPIDIIEEIVKTYDDTFATATSLMKKLKMDSPNAMSSLVRETFGKKSRELLIKHYASKGTIDDVEVIGNTAIVPGRDLIQIKIALIMDKYHDKIRRVLLKLDSTDVFTMLSRAGSMVYVPSSFSCEPYEMLMEMSGIEYITHHGTFGLKTIEEARAFAQAIVDYGMDGKKTLNVKVKFNEKWGNMTTVDQKIAVSLSHYPRVIPYPGDEEDDED